MIFSRTKRDPLAGVLTALVLTLSGCGTVVVLPDEPKVLLRKSEPQQLTIINTHGGPISILPCKEGDAKIGISNGDTISLGFQMVTVADLVKPETSWYPRWFEITGTYMLFPEPINTSCYMKPGPDIVIDLEHNIPGRSNKIRMNFQRCRPGMGWGDIKAPPATFNINSNQPAGIPIRLCPKVPG